MCGVGTSLLVSESRWHSSVLTILTVLYSEQVHASAPMLHQRRYTSWSRAPCKSIEQNCLQHVVWAVAATVSPGYAGLVDALYREAWRLLGEQDMSIDKLHAGGERIELVQAWILLAHGELMRRHERQAWIATGRCLQLVHQMSLYNLDQPGQSPPTPPRDWVEMEEKRRTFWMAFILDRLVGAREALPQSLGKQKVCLASSFFQRPCLVALQMGSMGDSDAMVRRRRDAADVDV